MNEETDYFIVKRDNGSFWPYVLYRGRARPFATVVNIYRTERGARRAMRKRINKGVANYTVIATSWDDE